MAGSNLTKLTVVRVNYFLTLGQQNVKGKMIPLHLTFHTGMDGGSFNWLKAL